MASLRRTAPAGLRQLQNAQGFVRRRWLVRHVAKTSTYQPHFAVALPNAADNATGPCTTSASALLHAALFTLPALPHMCLDLTYNNAFLLSLRTFLSYTFLFWFDSSAVHHTFLPWEAVLWLQHTHTPHTHHYTQHTHTPPPAPTTHTLHAPHTHLLPPAHHATPAHLPRTPLHTHTHHTYHTWHAGTRHCPHTPPHTACWQVGGLDRGQAVSFPGLAHEPWGKDV